MNAEKENVNPLGYAPLGGLIAKFAIPAIISMLVSSLYNIVDQIFIGWGVGMLGNAATNIAFPISIFCTSLSLLLGIGAASNYNINSGAGEVKKAEHYAGNGLSMLCISGVTYMVIVLIFLRPLLNIFGVTAEILPYALSYTGITAFGIPFVIVSVGGNHIIRADRSPTYSMVSVLSGAVLNTILDPIFIFVFGMGISGAAIATVISQILSGLMVLIYFIKYKKMNLDKDALTPNAFYLKGIVSVGMASCINQLAIGAVQIAMNNTLKHYGAVSVYGSDIPIACAGIISKINMVFMAICIGISQGCQPIFGFNFGAKKYDRVIGTYKRAFILTLTIGTVFFICFQLFPRQIVGIFGQGSDIYFEFAVKYIRIFLFLTFANGLHPMSSNFYTSMGKAKLGAIVSLTRQILFLLPMILIFPVFFGIEGVMYAGPIADAIALVIALMFAYREIKIMKTAV